MTFLKSALFVFLACVSQSLPLPSQELVPFRLRVRELDAGPSLPERGKEDFRLTVNGRPTEIIALRKNRRSLGIKPDLGRAIVLSFRLTEIGPPVERALAYLASEILDIQDRLFVRTPISLYRLNVVPNREGMLREIRNLVNDDGQAYGKSRASVERRLEGYLTDVRGAIGGDPHSVDAYKKTSMFMNSFAGEFKNYQERFLLPDPKGCRLALDEIPYGEGERWWIHFEQQEASDFFLRIRRTIDAIRGYLQDLSISQQTMAQVLTTSLANVEKLVFMPEVFPSNAMMETFLGSDMNYGVVFIRGQTGTEPDYAEIPYHNLEMLHGRVAKACGGLVLRLSGAERGIKELADHTDEFHEIVFGWGHHVEEMKIQVDLAGGEGSLSYASRLSEGQVRSRLDLESQEKIRVGGISLEEGRLHFDLESFAPDPGEKIGLLKVRVQLYDPEGREVYHQENNLRATENKVGVSLPIPEQIAGKLRVIITVCDLVANRLTVAEGSIELKE